MKKLLARLFGRKTTVVVQTYKVRQTDYEKRRRAMTAMLARELGRPNPLEGR
jgi:hypothetical protein